MEKGLWCQKGNPFSHTAYVKITRVLHRKTPKFVHKAQVFLRYLNVAPCITKVSIKEVLITTTESFFLTSSDYRAV